MRYIRYLTAVALSLFSLELAAQSADGIKEEVNKVADLVIQNTSYKFINDNTGETYKTTRGLPDTVSLKSASPYTTWYYPYGVLAIGMIHAGEIFHEQKLIDYASKNYAFIFKNLEFFKNQYLKGQHKIEYQALFRMKYLDDCGAMGSGLVDVYQLDSTCAGASAYRDYINRAGLHILHGGEGVLSDGTFCRPRPRKMVIWGDDLYMGVSLLARMGKLTGNHQYFDEAMLQVKNFNKYLYDRRTDLYFHCWYSDIQMNGVAHWGRANGWVMLAQVALLNNLPESYPGKAGLVKSLQRQIIGVSRYQDPSGLWHQLLDRPDSFLESSASAMFVYSIARAVNEGWIPKTYLIVAEKGWAGLETKIDDKGQVENVCVGTNVHDDISYYYTRPVKTEDPHALGPVLLAGSELYRALRVDRKK